jgi:hypothetical protein
MARSRFPDEWRLTWAIRVCHTDNPASQCSCATGCGAIDSGLYVPFFFLELRSSEPPCFLTILVNARVLPDAVDSSFFIFYTCGWLTRIRVCHSASPTHALLVWHHPASSQWSCATVHSVHCFRLVCALTALSLFYACVLLMLLMQACMCPFFCLYRMWLIDPSMSCAYFLPDRMIW